MNTVKLPIEVEAQLKKVSKIGGYLWQREWPERKAGKYIDEFNFFI